MRLNLSVGLFLAALLSVSASVANAQQTPASGVVIRERIAVTPNAGSGPIAARWPGTVRGKGTLRLSFDTAILLG